MGVFLIVHKQIPFMWLPYVTTSLVVPAKGLISVVRLNLLNKNKSCSEIYCFSISYSVVE